MIVVPLPPQFIRIRTGIFEKKHMERFQSGWPWVLYFWLQSTVRFKGDGVGTTLPDQIYTHEAASKALCQPAGSVRRWFYELMDAGYIESKRLGHGLSVTITKYRAGPPVVPTHEQSECPPMSSQSAHGRAVDETPECPPMNARVPTHERPSAHGRAVAEPRIKEARARQESKRARESTPPPLPAPSWRDDVTDAFVARGLKKPNLDENEGIAARKLLRENAPDLLAQCWQDVEGGEYGDDSGWLQHNLSFVTLYERQRFENWLMWKAGATKAPKRKGPESSVTRMMRVSNAMNGRTQRAITAG